MPGILTVVLAIAAGVVALIGLTADAMAQKRVALVIGNGAYTKVPALANPSRDAAALETLLRASGFDLVRRADNLKLAELRRALRDFSAQVADADIAIVFFAGHGIEVNGTNYLIPVDAVLEHDIDVQDEALSLDRVSQALEPAKRLRLIMLDACRDNPFVRSIKRTAANRSIGRGLAAVEVMTSDTLIAYAAKAGYTAADGIGATNSPYTLALLNHLATPGLDVRLALGRVRDEVIKTTGSRQEPFVYGSLGGAEIALVAGKAPELKAGEASTQRLSEAAEVWDRTKDSTSVVVLEAFAGRYKDTFYAELARARVEDLKKQQVAAAKTEPLPKGKEAKPGLLEKTVGLILPGEQKEVTGETMKRGTVFRDCPECPEMVVVPAGEFMMGSSDSEEGRKADEGPRHRVTIRRPFAVGKFEVTFAEWDACVADRGCGANKTPSDEGWGRGKRPAINITWDNATQYVAWLTAKTAKTYRLLTEAEWEYAARGVTSASATHPPFSTGSTITTDQANYYTGKQSADPKTVSVGSFPGNAFGLHDMHGNAYEWVEDCYKDSYAGAPTDGSAVTSPACSVHVGRGGYYGSPIASLRSADRCCEGRSIDYFRAMGFRVARSL